MSKGRGGFKTNNRWPKRQVAKAGQKAGPGVNAQPKAVANDPIQQRKKRRR